MTPLQNTLSYRLHFFNKATDYVTQKAYEETVGLSLSEGRCFASIGSFAPLSVNKLAAAANLNKAQASRASDALVKKGLIIKKTCTYDKRGVVLELSPDGKEHWKKTMELIQHRNNEIFSCLTPEEKAQFSQLLDRLIENL